jgi:23S rRNA (uracil1939-C5)-methyltransferase
MQIEKAIYCGSFLARSEGKATFVPLALPGETVSARINQEKRGYATAEIDEIVTSAPGRIAPACRHFGACGGCQYQHADYRTQLAMKQAILRETLERGGVRAPESFTVRAGTESEAWGYRNRIRLAFDARGNPGYRGRRSNAVVAIADCPIAAPLLVRTALTFAEVIRQAAPALRVEELSLFCNATETSLLATLFVKHAPQNVLDRLAHEVSTRIPELKGIDLVTATTAHDDRQVQRTIARWGEDYLAYTAAGFDYRVDHGAFFQVNRRLIDTFVERITAKRTGELAWDLFAGVGLFARKLTAGFDRVIAVESAPAAIPGLEANLRGTSALAVQSSTLSFLHRTAKAEKPDLIIVDPPRAGLGPEITGALADVGASILTYVSCDPATLARDLRALLATGYSIESVTFADLFPQTYHLETVVDLRRS